MGYNDRMVGSGNFIEVTPRCSHCHKKYDQWQEPQVAGFRTRDYDYCPYCGESNGSSMQVEYHNSKLDTTI